MEFANRMRPKGASDTLYIFQTPFKDLYVHLSIYTAIYSIYEISGYEWDIHLLGSHSLGYTYTAIHFHLS